MLTWATAEKANHTYVPPLRHRNTSGAFQTHAVYFAASSATNGKEPWWASYGRFLSAGICTAAGNLNGDIIQAQIPACTMEKETQKPVGIVVGARPGGGNTKRALLTIGDCVCNRAIVSPKLPGGGGRTGTPWNSR